MAESKKQQDEDKITTSTKSDEQKQEVESPQWWPRGLIIDPESGGQIWPRYSFPESDDRLQSLIAGRREAIDSALNQIPAEIKNGIEQTLHRALESQYYQNIAWGNKPRAEASREFLRDAIVAAKRILGRMLRDLKNGYNYGQGDIFSIIGDNILEFESVLEARKKQRYLTDISAEVRHVVSYLDSLKKKGIANNDEIGRILLAAGLFQRIKCVYSEHMKMRPRIMEEGLQIEHIPLDEWPEDLRPLKTRCQYFETIAGHTPVCCYSRTGSCKKATDKVQRIISANRS